MLANPFSQPVLPTLNRGGIGSSSGPGQVYGASFAPLGAFGGGAPFSSFTSGSSQSWARYLRRFFAVSQWDLDATFWTLITSFRSPSGVFKMSVLRKQTKNSWSRDDPAIVAVLLGFLAVVAVAYGVAYRYTSPFAYLWLISQTWFSFVAWGLAASAGMWALVNARCRVGGGGQSFALEQRVEFLYAVDVHCNAFTSILVWVYVVNFLLLPVTMGGKMNGDGIFQCFIGNALYAGAIGQYLYCTFQGYMVLPFLQHEKLRPLLAGIVGVAFLAVLLTLFHFNVAKHALSWTVA